MIQCIDYENLFEKNNLRDSINLDKFFDMSFYVSVYFYIACIIFIYEFIKILYKVKKLYNIKYWYENHLGITEDEINCITWNKIVQSLIELSRNKDNQYTCSAKDIVGKIMRKNNYFIAIVDMEILNNSLYLPFYGKYNFISRTTS